MHVTFTALAPIHHGQFGLSTGNAINFRRFSLVRDGAKIAVPAISGNSLRGILRRLVMRELFDHSGVSRETLPGRPWDRLYAALANGGHLDKEQTALDPVYIRNLREALPPLSVFGAALYSWMLSGRMSVGILWPVCAETVALGLVKGESTMPAEDMIEEISHVRHVDREQQDPTVSGVTPMPTTMETLVTGTMLECEITVGGTDLEAAVISNGLDMLRTIGAKTASGLGVVRVTGQQDATAYLEWLNGGTAEAALRLLAAKLA